MDLSNKVVYLLVFTINIKIAKTKTSFFDKLK